MYIISLIISDMPSNSNIVILDLTIDFHFSHAFMKHCYLRIMYVKTNKAIPSINLIMKHIRI